ncbi:mitochondrial sodium/calcium exchanger protein-like isoform X2 [Teleopsis dalmanni]|uniref:mitochondrial sodium/calcium exchanger protein-like isoform X2 n=1 Tax=Teleopsis dalmanni TaxID=139649 RepID=UPI0018CCA778|nr:mitochondrial sodium/calcium exchanger protein-like isoform X2 [Teleopsis dalmanni]
MKNINLSELSNGTTRMFLRRQQRHSSFIQPNTWVHCYHPTELNTDTQNDCLYVRNNSRCKEYVQLINYLEFIVCKIGATSSISGLIQIFACTSILLCFYFLGLIVIGRYFLIPNILTMNKIFRFPDFEFGYSIITFFMVFCDFIEAVIKCYTYEGMASLEISENIGQVLCTLSVGMIVFGFSKKFHRYQSSHFLRLILMLFFGLTYLVWILDYKQQQDEEYNSATGVDVNLKIHAAGMVIVYALILFFTLALIKRIPIADIKRMEEQSFDNRNRLFPEDKQLLMYIYTFNPFANMKNWKLPTVLTAVIQYLFICKCVICLHYFYNFKTPLWVLAALQIPVVDQNRPMNGWSRNAVLISFFTFPLILCMYFNSVIALYIGLPFGVIAALVTHCTTEVDRKPSFHEIYSIYGVAVAMFWIYLIDNEIENIVWQLATYLGNWSIDTIVLTTFPAGFGIIVYTICSTLVSQDRGELALGVLTGISVFCTYFPLAVVKFRICSTKYDKVVVTANTYTGFVFMLLILVYTMVYVFILRYELRRSYGYAVLTEYIVYLIVMLLSEFQAIHPYGATHAILKGAPQSAYWS